MSVTDFIWTDAAVEQLRALWAKGLSSMQISRRMPGTTKNAIIGKAHRLNLPSRASPIKKTGAPKAQPIIRKTPTLPPLPPRALFIVPAPIRPPAPVRVARPPEPPPEPPVVFKPRKPTACCWPFGDPKSPDFRFCDATALEGRSYCQEHHARAYVPRRERTPAELAADEARRLEAHARMASHGGAWRSGSARE